MHALHHFEAAAHCNRYGSVEMVRCPFHFKCSLDNESCMWEDSDRAQIWIDQSTFGILDIKYEKEKVKHNGDLSLGYGQMATYSNSTQITYIIHIDYILDQIVLSHWFLFRQNQTRPDATNWFRGTHWTWALEKKALFTNFIRSNTYYMYLIIWSSKEDM